MNVKRHRESDRLQGQVFSWSTRSVSRKELV